MCRKKIYGIFIIIHTYTLLYDKNAFLKYLISHDSDITQVTYMHLSFYV